VEQIETEVLLAAVSCRQEKRLRTKMTIEASHIKNRDQTDWKPKQEES